MKLDLKDPTHAVAIAFVDTVYFRSAVDVTDAAFARRLAENHSMLRYTPELGQWFIWDEDRHVWCPSPREQAAQWVRHTLTWQTRAIAWRADDEHTACGTKRVTPDCTSECKYAQHLVQSIRRYASSRGPETLLNELVRQPSVLTLLVEWDADPDIINTLSGIVNLRDGSLVPHESRHDLRPLLTKTTGCKYRPGATHPDWTQALDAISGLSPDTQRWLQMFLGSGASGRTPPDSLNVLLKGGGANGKSTVLGGISTSLGGYASAVSDAALDTSNKNEQRLAMLDFRGVRFALLEETTDDMRLATTALKKLSSGNEVLARAMYKGNVSFKASHTLAIATNHAPYVRETDKGTWRRLVLIPFTKDYTLEPTFDNTIRERVIAGEDGRAEAVLAWLIEGCVAWYSAGMRLTPIPAELMDSTEEWRADTDLVGEFIKGSITVTGSASDTISKGDLYEQFETWCEHSHQKNPYGGQRGFNAALKNHEKARGVADTRRHGGVHTWTGIRSPLGCSVTALSP